MDNSKKLTLFRDGSDDGVGFVDISTSMYLQMDIINGSNGSNMLMRNCLAVQDGTLVAPCGCMRIIPIKTSRMVCSCEPDGTLVALCGCMRIIPIK